MKYAVLLSFLLVGALSLEASAGPADLAYFKEFIYKKENISDDPDFPEYQYRFLMTTWNDMVPLADGRYMNPGGSIYLYEDGTFLFTYRENYFEKPDAQQFIPGPCKKITGKWSVPDTKLVLEGVGSAERATVDGFNGIRLTYEKDLHSPGLKNHAVDASYAFSNTDMIFCF